MSDKHDSHDDHGHDDHDHAEGAVHVHIHSLRFYGGILITLIFLTVLTVATSLVDIDGLIEPGTPQGAGGFNLALALIIATIKAGFVVTFFMHLRDDSRFNALIFVGSVLFVGIFFAYTMNDTGHRGLGDPFYGVHVLPTTGERAPGGVQCTFEGEEPEHGVHGTAICGYNDLRHIVACNFVAEDGAVPEGNVCIWENDVIMAVSAADYAGGRHGGAPPAHEGAEHEGGGGSEHSAGHGEHGEHGEGAAHGE